MTRSMTGFVTASAQIEGWSWVWDVRSVNGKGLDLRLRLPDWIDGLEAGVRAVMAPLQTRGNVSLTLKLARDDSAPPALRINAGALRSALAAMAQVEAAATTGGVALTPASAVDVLAMRHVMDTGSAEDMDSGPLRTALLAHLPAVLDAFHAMRAQEGAALSRLLVAQVDQIAGLVLDAQAMADARTAAMQTHVQGALARVLDTAAGVDPARLLQEIALIAVKADVTEELDRLTAHVAAARALLAETGPVGRKLDFLMQEFMREANTLCSKAQSIALTRIGLDLKVVIDQMREQVQNVE